MTSSSPTSEELLTAGIDVGSAAIKTAIIASPAGSGRAREGARVVGQHLERIRRRDQKQVIDICFEAACATAGIEPDDIAYIATTGEGELVDFRTGHFYGMTAHARGAHFLNPDARIVIDVGALHTRSILIDERSRVLSYRMTSQCASGSGQFLENIARYLGVTPDEIGELSLSAEDPAKISSICAVLAETDVINMVSRGIATEDILRGIHESMAGRYSRLLRYLRVEGVVFLSGGLSNDLGLKAALADALAADKRRKGGPIELVNHPLGIFAGALGAAIWGEYRHGILGLEEAAWHRSTPSTAISSSAP